jgi:hypothetical protein
LKLLLLSFLFILTSCSLAPFSATNSARSNGAGNVSAEFGNSNSNYFIKMDMGLSKNMDIGYVMEFGNFQTSAIYGKYSFLNNKTGPSLAGEFGYGSSDETIFYYGGAIGSIAFSKSFEVFANVRLNQVSADENNIEVGDKVGNIEVEDLEATYVYASAGFNIWFTESTGLSIYTIYVKGEGVNADPQSSAGGAFLFKF